VMNGRNAAFVDNFADVSVIFTDKWITSGKQFWRDRKNSPVVLKWEPEYMDIAASCDFGVSTGPWESQEYRPNTAPLSTGYFLTVWKKQTDDVWKVILDAGSGTPVPSKPHSFSYPEGADRKDNRSGTTAFQNQNDLTETENQMLITWKNNPHPSSYKSFLAVNARLQYDGHLPSASFDTINKFLTSMDKTLLWKTTGSGAAASSDLGFTYGYLFTKMTTGKPSGHYVRIWKKQSDGKWLISIDMLSYD
jgi:ketosteroid isomerase-like protein